MPASPRLASALLALSASLSSVSGQTLDAPAPASPLPGLRYDEPFFPNARHDAAVPTPDSLLGFPVGSRPATPAQIEAVLRALAERSPRARLVEYARSHEGRPLHYLVVASEGNLRRLDELKAGYAKLADPRKAPPGEVDRLAAGLPALAWMAYTIHGDEASASDASLALAHHLAASSSADVKALLDAVVVVIDPLMNPDGRERHVAALAQNRTAQPAVDDQSLLHAAAWPGGRTNHYLFDLNRDWLFASQPETRGRIRAIGEWHPHYFVEGHEMGSQSTFAFYPPAEAINNNYPDNVRKWEGRFGEDLAAAFDRRGWRYYNGEQYDNWYPGYSSSWAALRGIVDNLYEQARVGIDAVRRAEGALHPYRESVHKQLVASMANLEFLARHRREILADYVAEKRRCVGPAADIPARYFVIPPPVNGARHHRLVDYLALQGIEAQVAGQAFRVSGKDRLHREVKDVDVPAGSILIPSRQPLARLALALFEFDPRMSPQFLIEERRELLRFDRSLIYDVTGWSLPMLFDVEAYAATGEVPADAQPRPLGAPPAAPEALVDAAAGVGFVIDGRDDGSTAAAGRLMERGVWLRVAEKPFQFGERSFARSSVVISRRDNARFAGDLAATVREVCSGLGVAAVGVGTGYGLGDRPDLGGRHFELLQPPRVAVFGREPFSAESYGECWHAIDHTLGLRASFIDFHRFKRGDLRRYNVIVLPHGANAEALKDQIGALKEWVEAGGTLIAIGSSAGALARDPGGIGSVRLLPATLGKPEPFLQAVIREWEGRVATIDSDKVWSASVPAGEAASPIPWHGAALRLDKDDRPGEEELKRRDDWRKIFMPRGAVLAGRVDDRSWLTAGAGDYLPVVYQGDVVLMTAPAAEAPVRLGYFQPTPPASTEKPATEDAAKKIEKRPPGWVVAPPGHEMRLRMSGLLWPEAAERLANSAYVAREGLKNGQVVLFASNPLFRAGALGTRRVFLNAVVFGPGLGARQPILP